MGFLGVRAGSLSNKTVVITGASAGLGATLAVECAQQGARLVLLARNAERLEAVARECEQLGSEVLTVVGDVAIAEDGRRLVEAAIERFGSIDYLIANAGVSMWTEFAAIEDVTLFRKLMEVNYLGAVHCVHPALPHLKKSKGLFVAISSIQGQVGVPLHTGYSASKHALQGFCDALRMEVAESGVGAMTVLLHWLKGTELRQRALGKDGKALGCRIARASGGSGELGEGGAGDCARDAEAAAAALRSEAGSDCWRWFTPCGRRWPSGSSRGRWRGRKGRLGDSFG